MRTLLIDNYDSYTYNLSHLLAQVNGQEPIVVTHDARELPRLVGADATDDPAAGFDNIVISPGPGHPGRRRDFGIAGELLARTTLPVLGVCLGHQGIALAEGGQVVMAPQARHGHVERVRHEGDDPLFAGVPEEFDAVRYHSLAVAEPLPPRLKVIARATDGVVMALRHRELPRWGVQFHPESVASEGGARMLANFRDLTREYGGGATGKVRKTYRGVADQAVADRTPEALAPATAPPPAPASGSAQGRDDREPAPAREPAPVPRSVPDPAAVRPHAYTLHVREIEGALETEAAFAALYADVPGTFWLDSARVEEGLSRFSFLGDTSGPLAERLRYRADEGLVIVEGGAAVGPAVYRGTVLDYLQRESARRTVRAPELPFEFTGGWVGYLGYEAKADCGHPNTHRAATPDAVWLFPDRFLVVDHAAARTYLCALGDGPGTDSAAAAWLDSTARHLAGLTPLPPPGPEPEGATAVDVEAHLGTGRQEYVRAVRACQEELLRGESYEICLTAAVQLPASAPAVESATDTGAGPGTEAGTGGGDGFETYRRLRRLNPAPYAAYLHPQEGLEIACSSPERFLRIGLDGTAETRPIKGTAPRGATPAEDEELRRALAAEDKTRAENLMIVDLLRNDLSRVCVPGTVTVPALMATESYATVHQLVSTVRGTLDADVDALDCLRACFPGGSMTGAPKRRTLEIIDHIEGRARGVYSGTLGWIGCNGAADLNIVIRTLVRHEGSWHLGAGGAVVLASDPEEEYAEMLLKAEAPARALRVTGTGTGTAGGAGPTGRTVAGAGPAVGSSPGRPTPSGGSVPGP